MEHATPSDIERTSLSILSSELEGMGIVLPTEQQAVVKRVIHATADFDYAVNLRFTDKACQMAQKAMSEGCAIVTDTNMAKAGISKTALEKLNCRAECYMAEPEIALRAKEENTTRAVASMKSAAENYPTGIYAIGNAPTALYELSRQMDQGMRPSLVIAVPVGFVNVVEAKEEIFSCCERYKIPCIAAMGRKGGSTVATAICNALLYETANLVDPAKRGWQ